MTKTAAVTLASPDVAPPPTERTTTPCPEENELVAFVEARVDAEGRHAIEVHLDQCDACRELLASFAQAHGGAPAADVRPDAAETSVVGRYQLGAEIGRGGMGIVYRAHDPVLDRAVAIKAITSIDPRSRVADSSEYDRLLREARAMARVAHPNVVPVFDAVVEHGSVYLVMELVDGPSLRAHLASTPALSIDDKVALFRAAAAGLAAAHTANVVHRDFKPENVLVGRGGARVTDFGLARPPSKVAAGEGPSSADARWLSTDATRGLAGTPAYLSPEQIDGAGVDARSDQFSFAVALFEALHGTHPFGLGTRGGPTTVSELRAAMNRGPLQGRGAGAVPRWIDDVVRRALSPRPSDRWADMQALARALAQATDGRARSSTRHTAPLAPAPRTPWHPAAHPNAMMRPHLPPRTSSSLGWVIGILVFIAAAGTCTAVGLAAATGPSTSVMVETQIPEETTKQLVAHGVLAKNERPVAFYDESSEHDASSGFVVTSERVSSFSKAKTSSVRLADVVEIKHQSAALGDVIEVSSVKGDRLRMELPLADDAVALVDALEREVKKKKPNVIVRRDAPP